MDVWDLIKLLIALVGLVLGPLLILNYLRNPTLQVVIESAVADPRTGPRLYYHINLRLKALYGPITLQRIKLSHPRVPGTQLQVNYALGEHVTRDLLALTNEEFLAQTQHHLGDKPSALPPSIRLPGRTLQKGKALPLTFAGFIPFITSNRQLELIPIDGWELEITHSGGIDHFEVFDSYRKS